MCRSPTYALLGELLNKLCRDGADLLLEVLEELIEGALHTALDNHLGNRGDLAFSYGIRIVVQGCLRALFQEINNAGGLNGAHRTGWVRDQRDAGRWNYLTCLYIHGVWSLQAGDIG